MIDDGTQESLFLCMSLKRYLLMWNIKVAIPGRANKGFSRAYPLLDYASLSNIYINKHSQMWAC